MHAIQFVNELASLIGRDAKSIRVVDRALAECGLRQTSTGRKFPDVTLDEALLLLLAMLSGYPATRAAEGASKLASFRLGNGYQRNPEILAKLLKISLARLAKLSLQEVMGLLCIGLARGKIDRNVCQIRLDVSDGGFALISISHPLSRADGAEVAFRGRDPVSGGEGYWETRSATTPLFQWIGEKAVIPESTR